MSASLPSPFVYIPTLYNLRDIGGYRIKAAQNSSQCIVKPSIVYRSADPSYMPPEALERFTRLGITTIFDLRSRVELDRAKDEGREEGPKGTERLGVARVWSPVFSDEDYSPEQIALRYRDYSSDDAEGFKRAYADILKQGGQSYRLIFQHLAGLSQQPASSRGASLVHCTAGKDRTGVFIALLLSILGVEDELIAEEYSLTEQGLEEVKAKFLERLTQNEAFKHLSREEAWAGCERMVGARKESMLKTLDYVREHYGSAEGYARRVCGLSDDEIAGLRASLVVTAPIAARL